MESVARVPMVIKPALSGAWEEHCGNPMQCRTAVPLGKDFPRRRTFQSMNSTGMRISRDEKIWWMIQGWIKFRHQVFAGWDKALANENFPRHTGGAIVLDALGYFDQYVTERPEDLLEYSDWMGIPIQAYPASLERFKSLLAEQAEELRK